MIDGQRVYPVTYFFLHHSTGNDFVNASDIEVQDWYSDTGKARGYSNGAINSNHEHPSRDGQQTYAMAQLTLREYTLDGNKYGWRLTDLMKNPWQNVAWAVGDWWYNQRSVSVEVCGNYLGKLLPDKALMCLADYLRPIDEELGGALQVWLHQEVFATACPARIAEQRNTIIDMINNPAAWEAKLWPAAPAPQPAPTPAPAPVPVETAEQKEIATLKQQLAVAKELAAAAEARAYSSQSAAAQTAARADRLQAQYDELAAYNNKIGSELTEAMSKLDDEELANSKLVAENKKLNEELQALQVQPSPAPQPPVTRQPSAFEKLLQFIFGGKK